MTEIITSRHRIPHAVHVTYYSPGVSQTFQSIPYPHSGTCICSYKYYWRNIYILFSNGTVKDIFEFTCCLWSANTLGMNLETLSAKSLLIVRNEEEQTFNLGTPPVKEASI